MTTVLQAAKSHNLFEVYLRLRPPQAGAAASDRFLEVEPPATDAPSTVPTHIRLNPPNDRRRAIEKFCFTQVFEEDATQLDLFHCTGVVPLVEGALAPHGGEGTDALFATLGVTGSGKSHTILGSRSQRGLTQLVLDVVFRSIGENIADCATTPSLEASITAADASEATIYAASTFLDAVYADAPTASRSNSLAQAPALVGSPPLQHTPLPIAEVLCLPDLSFNRQLDENAPRVSNCSSFSELPIPGRFPTSPSGLPRPRHYPDSVRLVNREDRSRPPATREMCLDPVAHSRSELWPTSLGMCPETCRSGPVWRTSTKTRAPVTRKNFMASTAASKQQERREDIRRTLTFQGEYSAPAVGGPPPPAPRRLLSRPSAFPQQPDVSGIQVDTDPAAQYAVLISMYEVYNDRIFDLLTPPVKSAATKEYRRRPLLFKSTETSPDRKVVAGLRKIICGDLNQALLVLEAGLHQRRVAGTGSNSVSSRSHGFVCVEVKKRPAGRLGSHTPWSGSTLTVVDLAGSERARDAKTVGTTLAEAGKINESLMYLGQCLQMQSDVGNSNKPSVVPFRQCKLTELLFSNSFPSASMVQSSQASHSIRRNPQKAVMIVTADPQGDFNATSQILRYSALAREITVPRIPSIAQTILGANHSGQVGSMAPLGSSPPFSTISLACSDDNGHSQAMHHLRPFLPSGSSVGGARNRTFSPCSNTSSDDRVTMEIAALEIARMSEEIEYLRAALEQESAKRLEAESHLLSITDRMLDVEQAIREDCAAEFDQRLALEQARWKASLEVEKERGEEHWDRKVDVLERMQDSGGGADDESGDGCGHDDKENVLVENLEEENERLRREVLVLRRELTGRSPVKRKPLREREDLPMGSPPMLSTSPVVAASGGKGGDALHRASESMRRKMEKLRVSEADTAATESILGRGGGRPSGNSSRSAASTGSPKKVRKLSPRKWDVAVDDDDLC